MEILAILKEVQAVITDDHFVYTSGKHGSVYINKDAIYPHTKLSSDIGKLFAEKVKDLEIDAVVAPALGGIVLSQWTAYHLSELKGKDILGIYTEKDADGNQLLKRGYDKLITGKNVLVIEDLTNTGGSVLKVVNAVKEAGGNVISVGVMVNRSPKSVNEAMFQVPFFALGELPAEAFDASTCPLCEKNIPINTSVGHGKKYVEAKS
jgi:orotate phosphoribosyltransferase